MPGRSRGGLLPGLLGSRLSVFLAAAFLFIPRGALAADYFFKTDPPVVGAEVLVDGRPAGTTDANGKLIIEGIAAGPHTIRVEAAGVLVGTAEVTFDPEVNSLPSLPVAVEAAPPPEVPGAETVDYIVDTNVPDVEVFVDGRLAARTGNPDASAFVRLVVGQSYALRVAKSGFLPAEQRVTASDVGNRIRLILAPAPAAGEGAGAAGERSAGGPPLSLLVVTVLVVVAGGVLAFVLLRQRQEEGAAAPARVSGSEEKTRTPISFDQYRVSGTLGQGGVAIIYRAVDSTSGGPVALKILDAKWMGDPDMVQKFLSEAEAIRAIHRLDPEVAVVKVHRSGREGERLDGRPFLALELLEGETLEAVLDRSRTLAEPEALGIGFQIARVLDVVHRAGIVHRDLTPDNIFLVPGAVRIGPKVFQNVRRAVLIDFGVARQEFLSRVTMDGSIAGKPPYMSPEQCRGEKVDARSDLYALGLILHALLAGQPPFTGRNPFDVMRAQQHDAPPPLDGRASPEYARLVLDLLHKSASDRPRSAVEVAGRIGALFLSRISAA